MSRIIRRGTPDKFLKIADLPTNFDNSYFEYCDLSNLDLSKSSLKGATFYRCLAKRTIFPPWLNMEDFYSRCHYEGGDPRPYEDAVVPKDRPDADQHDLVVEMFFQAGMDDFAVFTQSYETACWDTVVPYMAGKLGGTEQAKDALREAFKDYPRMLRRVDNA